MRYRNGLHHLAYLVAHPADPNLDWGHTLAAIRLGMAEKASEA